MSTHRIVTNATGGYVYRGFRIEPCFVSPTTGVAVKSQRGWYCIDLPCGYVRYSGSTAAWYNDLKSFSADIDEIYERSADGKLRNERVRALRAAIERLPDAEEARAALATLEAGLQQAADKRAESEAQARKAEAEHEARRRLHEAAPALLEALTNLVADMERILGRRIPDDHEARAAIAAATGEV